MFKAILGSSWIDTKVSSTCVHPCWVALVAALLGSISGVLRAQTSSYDAASHVLRLDGGGVTYAVGVDAQGSLATVYWGARLAPSDSLPRPRREGRAFDFDDEPQEYAGWGGGLYAEPSLKVTFPDGNRDLVLHYVSHTLTADGADIVLRDVSRDVTVTLHYVMDAETGILARSAEILNKTAQPFTVGAGSGGRVEPAVFGCVSPALPHRPMGRRDAARRAAAARARHCARKPAGIYRS